MPVINWLISTVETEMAGPIVAVAVLHPETHEILVKAEPAIMLTLSIFFAELNGNGISCRLSHLFCVDAIH